MQTAFTICIALNNYQDLTMVRVEQNFVDLSETISWSTPTDSRPEQVNTLLTAYLADAAVDNPGFAYAGKYRIRGYTEDVNAYTGRLRFCFWFQPEERTSRRSRKRAQ